MGTLHRLRQLRKAVQPIVDGLWHACRRAASLKRRAEERRYAPEPLEPRQLLTAIVVEGTQVDETWLLRTHPDNPLIVQLFDNADAQGQALYEVPLRRLESIRINGHAGDDALIVDMSQRAPFHNGLLTFDAGTDGAAGDSLMIIGNSAARALYRPGANGAGVFVAGRKAISLFAVESLAAAEFRTLRVVTPGSSDDVTLDTPEAGKGRVAGVSDGAALAPVTFSSVSNLVLDTAANDTGAGNDTITVNSSGIGAAGQWLWLQAGVGVNVLNVNGGATNLVANVAPGGQGFLVANVSGSAVVNLPRTQYLAELNIHDSARVNLPPDAYKVLLLDGLSITESGRLDLADNDMIVHSGNAQAITALIHSGYADGTWGGCGIITSTASTYTAIGITLNRNNANQTLYTTWSNQPVTGTDVLVKFSYAGDANVDGVVNADDYFRIDIGWMAQLTGWYNGDFDYDNAVTADDYFIIDRSYLGQGLPKPPMTVSGEAAVDEGTPYTLTLDALTKREEWQEWYDFDTDQMMAGWVLMGAYDTIGSWTVNWGDGESATLTSESVASEPEAGVSLTSSRALAEHVYEDDGTYTITVSGKGEDLNRWAGTKTLAVNNVPPTLDIGGMPTADNEAEYALDLLWFDAGDDVGTWTINWGDGSPPQAVDWDVDGTYHTFANQAGAHDLTLTATDDDGAYVLHETIPAAPSGLTASAVSGTQINLAWSDNSTQEMGFAVECSTDGASYSVWDLVGPNVCQYSVTGLDLSTMYHFRVRAYSRLGSWASNVVSVTTPATRFGQPGNSSYGAPSDLTAELVPTGRQSDPLNVHLSWEDNSGNEEGFRIYYSTGGSFLQLEDVGRDVPTFTGSITPDAQIHRFAVAAFAGKEVSEWSSVVEVNGPPASPMVTSQATPTSIMLHWDAMPGATGYDIDHSTDGILWEPLATATTATSCTDADLEPETVYWYRARARNSAGVSSFSEQAVETLALPPTDLHAEIEMTRSEEWRGDSYTLYLTWTNRSLSRSGYQIDIKPGSLTWREAYQLQSEYQTPVVWGTWVPAGAQAAYVDLRYRPGSGAGDPTDYLTVRVVPMDEYYRYTDEPPVALSNDVNVANIPMGGYLGYSGLVLASENGSIYSVFPCYWFDSISGTATYLQDYFLETRDASSIEWHSVTPQAIIDPNEQNGFAGPWLRAVTIHHESPDPPEYVRFSGGVSDYTIWIVDRNDSDPVNLEVCRTGTRYGEVVPDAVEDDPNQFVVLVNNDDDVRPGIPDYDNSSPAIPCGTSPATDDDLIHVVLRKIPSLGYYGERVIIRCSGDVRLLAPDPQPQYLWGSVYGFPTTMDLVPLGIGDHDIDFWFEGIWPGEAFVSVEYTKQQSGITLEDTISFTIASLVAKAVAADEVNTYWSPLQDVQSYRIMRATKNDPENYTLLDTVAADEAYYDDSTALPATEYLYCVDAVYADGRTLRIGPRAVVTPPLPPELVRATNVSPAGVTITWQPNLSGNLGPDQYRILRSSESDPADFSEIAVIGSGASYYRDSDVAPDTKYYYVVSTITRGLDSGSGEVMMVHVPPTGPPAPPTNLQLAADLNLAIVLTWTDNSSNERRVRVERAISSGGFQTIAFVRPSQSTFRDSQVSGGTTYRYRVSAENAAGASAASNVATIVAPAGVAPWGGVINTDQSIDPAEFADTWIGGYWPDGEVIAGTTQNTAQLLGLEEARDRVQNAGLSERINVLSLCDGKHGVYHVYSKNGWFTEGEWIASFVFNARDTNDVLGKFYDAKRAADGGLINTTAKDVAEVLDLGLECAMVVIPGPQDAAIGWAVQKVAAKLVASKAGQMIWRAGKWVFKNRAGREVVGKEAEVVAREAKKLLMEELGAKEVKWASPEYRGRYMPLKVDWSEVIKSTKKGVARYKPGEDVELLERTVWKQGSLATKPGKERWKVMEFNRVVGASEGKEVRWVRVEETGGPDSRVIHGHPITYEEYRDLIKQR